MRGPRTTEREPTMSDLLASIHTLAQNVQALQEESRQRRAAEDAAKAARQQSPSTASSTSSAGESSNSRPTFPFSPFSLSRPTETLVGPLRERQQGATATIMANKRTMDRPKGETYVSLKVVLGMEGQEGEKRYHDIRVGHLHSSVNDTISGAVIFATLVRNFTQCGPVTKDLTLRDLFLLMPTLKDLFLLMLTLKSGFLYVQQTTRDLCKKYLTKSESFNRQEWHKVSKVVKKVLMQKRRSYPNVCSPHFHTSLQLLDESHARGVERLAEGLGSHGIHQTIFAKRSWSRCIQQE